MTMQVQQKHMIKFNTQNFHKNKNKNLSKQEIRLTSLNR